MNQTMCFAIFLGGVLLAPILQAQGTNFQQTGKLVPADGGVRDLYADSVAVQGSLIVVGATENDGPAGSNQGAAYLYHWTNSAVTNGWTLLKKITASDAESGDLFGKAVAVSGDTLVVGAYGKASSRGAAYVFERNLGGSDNWGQVTNLLLPGGGPNDEFGNAVALDGDTLVVAARGVSKACIFERQSNQWFVVKVLTPAAGIRYGRTVAVQRDTIIVGDDTGQAVYVYERNYPETNSWGQVRQLTGTGDFGKSAAIDGNVIVVGAVYDSPAGSASVFLRDLGGSDNWGQVVKLRPSDTAWSWFGDCVHMEHDTIVVGASGAPVNGNVRQGAVYVFRDFGGQSTNWFEVAKLTASDGIAEASLGDFVSIDDGTIVAGAPESNYDPTPGPGAAYIFTTDFDSDGIPDGVDPDDDNDGMADAAEIAAGTDPKDASSILRITGVEYRDSETWLDWKGGSSVTQIVERCTDLLSAAWQPIWTNVPPMSTNQAAPVSNTDTIEFYRIRIAH